MIYICIPTHNEQQTVGVVLWKLRQVLTEFPRDYQLLVADDASTDKTAAVLEPYTRVLPLTVIRNEQRLGYAASLELLLREAVRRSEYPKRDVVVALQADFSDEPDDLVPLIKRVEAGADVAVGNKVSSAKETRTRRLSRSLASFFARRQKWPEGVESPFDGYRAYRLYAVKRAIEERAGTRLIRYDGWAGHAQLLKAVMPHARRVDVVNVDDRLDRLQRPRRERPFASALQVRAMAGGAEPAGLTGVEELDRIATTASRSRDRAAAVARDSENGTRGNGARSRDRRPAGQEGRSRQANGGGERSRPAEPKSRGGKPAQTRQQGRTQEPQPDQTRRSARQRRPPTAAETKPSRSPETETAAADLETEPLAGLGGTVAAAEVTGVADDATTTEAKPKRKRRRRRRSKTGEAQTSAEARSADDETAGAEAGAAGGAGPAEVESESGPQDAAATERKRRRRGGRRGGRGRRRPQVEGEPQAGADQGGESAPAAHADQAGPDHVEHAAPERAAHVEND